MKKTIDLSLELNNDLQVYPGDPPVDIEQIQTFAVDGWNMNRLHINGHDGTHVNASYHGLPEGQGKTLDQYDLEDFIGKTVLFETLDDIKPGIGLIVNKQNIDMELAKIIAERRPKFVALAAEFEMDVEVEKFFFEHEILVFERIANTHKLPKEFIFYGVPLNIKGRDIKADGSPIRAFAIIEEQ